MAARPVSRQRLARFITAQLLAEPAQTKRWVERLAAYVVAHGMENEVELLLNDIAYQLLKQAGELSVRVTSATQLSDAVRAQLEGYLRAHTGATHVTMEEQIDKTLIGGLIARTPDAEFDNTVRRSLRKLAAAA